MPPLAIHALIGLGLATLIRSKAAKLGLVLGLVLPDIDIVLSAIVLVITGDPNLVVAAHRSVTHNGFLIAALLIVAGAATLIDRIRSAKRSRIIAIGILALAIGIFLHMFLDLFYMTGVTLLWPLSGEQFSIVPPLLETATDVVKKTAATLDLLAEVATYSVFLYLAIKKRTDRHMHAPLTAAILVNAAVYVPLLFIAQTPIGVNEFVLIAYIPGLFFTVFTVALPLLMRNTIYALGKK